MGKKTVLVVGGGGRCHAIVDALSRSQKVGKIYCAPGNAGIAALAECVPLKDTQIGELKEFALEHGVDLTVVGPEAALALGIVDEFTAAGLRIFGPTRAAAAIESSKDFAKGLMSRHNIPTASYCTFDNYDKAVEYVRKGHFPVVLKFDGLAAGKGVVIPESLGEAKRELKSMLVDCRFGKGKVVVEEFLTGPEFSFMCLVDGEKVWPLALAQDHKRAYEDDEGPNTGGMGAYSPLPFVTGKDRDFALERIMKPAAKALADEGRPFKGVLYGGLMKTPTGIKVIEFNCRFGDPETEVVLPRLETDIYEMFSAVVDGTPMPEIRWSARHALGFVLASLGYPDAYEKGFEIRGLEASAAVGDVRVYHMGTAFADAEGNVLSPVADPSLRSALVTNGGRVLMIVGLGDDLEEAKETALDAVGMVDCLNLFLRRDIGHWVIE